MYDRSIAEALKQCVGDLAMRTAWRTRLLFREHEVIKSNFATHAQSATWNPLAVAESNLRVGAPERNTFPGRYLSVGPRGNCSLSDGPAHLFYHWSVSVVYAFRTYVHEKIIRVNAGQQFARLRAATSHNHGVGFPTNVSFPLYSFFLFIFSTI